MFEKKKTLPITHGVLPALQLGNFMHLEPKYLGLVPLCLECRVCRTDDLPHTLRRRLRLVSRSSGLSGVAVLPIQSRLSQLWGARFGGNHVRINEEEHVWEGGTEVGPVNRTVAGGFGRINVFTTTAVEFDRFFIRYVCEADGEERLGLAEDAGAATKVGTLVFVELRACADKRTDSPITEITKRTILARPRDVMIHLA